MSSCEIQFLPSGATARVDAGTLLHQAAAQAGVHDLQRPCGGRASCGRCLLEVVSGECHQEARSAAEAALRRAGFVLACQTRALSDMVLRVPDPEAASLRVVTESHLLLDQSLLPEAAQPTPPVRKVAVQMPPPVVETGYGDLERLALALNGAAEGAGTALHCSLPLLRRLPSVVREREGRVTASLSGSADSRRLVGLEPDDTTGRHLGVACDLGTTTVALHLVDLANGEILATRSAYNRQAAHGADVITRIDYARVPSRQEELRQLALQTLNGLLEEAAEAAGQDPGQVTCWVVAGNTTMAHLLLGLPPAGIREAPYVPVANALPPITLGEVGLCGVSDGPVVLAPGVGSYVGGDISAGLLATGLTRRDEGLFLFMDLGTNGEIALGTSEWLVTCACSAGPAFEGSGIRCGMRAARGAVERVTLDSRGEVAELDVIGGGTPAGLCGSGLVSLLGELLDHGVIDRAGRFHPENPNPSVVRVGSSLGYRLAGRESDRGLSGGQAAAPGDLVLTEPDIENLLRSKAAMYAGCDLLLEKVGLSWEAVSSVTIAGGFGRYLDVERAIGIGLLPDLPLTRFHYAGNSSLSGAYLMLLSEQAREEVRRIASKMTYVDLSSEPAYMDRYVAALFLPHTDLGRFPSAAGRLGAGPSP